MPFFFLSAVFISPQPFWMCQEMLLLFVFLLFLLFHRKALELESLLKNLQAEDLQLYFKKTPAKVFFVRFVKYLGTVFLQNPSSDCFFVSDGCFSIFLKKN